MRATTVMTCAAHLSCDDCVSESPPPGLDMGVRCVWCESLRACRDYNKFERVFPCPDALRGGGGYPGGASCKHAGRAAVAVAAPMPPSQRPQAYAVFAHRPLTTQPVSVVIPSFARPRNLRHQLAYLLQLEPLNRNGSEILVSHGSNLSYAERDVIDRATAEACAAADGRCAASPVTHLDSTALNDEWFTAHRFFAAAASRNDVLLHLDDDLVPGEAMLQGLVDEVATEPGFPSAPAPGLFGPSGFGRRCGASGYGRGRGGDAAEAAVLTNLAAASKALNARYLAAFDGGIGALLRRSRGNGEDLTYSHVARRGGGPRRALGGCDGHGAQRDACAVAAGEFTYLAGAIHPRAGGAYHGRRGHYDVRDRICRCLAGTPGATDLEECVFAGAEAARSRGSARLRELRSEL